MELKDFIKETLVQINNGVKEAQEECLKSNGLINPMLDIPLSNEEKFNVDGKYYPATKVEFEIGLTEIDK
ncbi:SapC family protein, partial [Escherichia coli]|nr:SapC family protein [Escherichia coli]